MTTRYANLVAQSGTFQTTYVDLAGGTALDGHRLFSAVASSNSWQDGDLIGVHIRVDYDNWQVWTGSWDAENSRVDRVTLEDSAGTITNGTAVDVSLVLTASTLPHLKRRTTITASGSDLTVPIDGNAYVFQAGGTDVTLGTAFPPGISRTDFELGATLTILPPTGEDTCVVTLPDTWVADGVPGSYTLNSESAPVILDLTDRADSTVVVKPAIASEPPGGAATAAAGAIVPSSLITHQSPVTFDSESELYNIPSSEEGYNPLFTFGSWADQVSPTAIQVDILYTGNVNDPYIYIDAYSDSEWSASSSLMGSDGSMDEMVTLEVDLTGMVGNITGFRIQSLPNNSRTVGLPRLVGVDQATIDGLASGGD